MEPSLRGWENTGTRPGDMHRVGLQWSPALEAGKTKELSIVALQTLGLQWSPALEAGKTRGHTPHQNRSRPAAMEPSLRGWENRKHSPQFPIPC